MRILPPTPLLPQDQDIAFSLDISGWDEGTFRVLDFSLTESLSALYQGHITVVSRNQYLDPAACLDKPVVLRIHHKYDAQLRYFHGVVESMMSVGFSNHWGTYQISLMPDLHRLRHTSDARIFQQTPVPDIVQTLFKEQGILHYQLRLKDTRLEREYCVQYRETHLAFIERLLAEEGIFHCWDHGKERATLVLADLTQFGSLLDGGVQVEYNGQSNPPRESQYISQLQWRETVRPTGLQQRDYCFKKPYYSQSHTSYRQREQGREDGQDRYELYNAYGRYKEPNSGQRFTQYSLEAIRNDHSTGHGSSNCIHFSAGRRFELTEHPNEVFNRKCLLVSVHHHGQQPQALEEDSGAGDTRYSNQFQAIAETGYAWRPTQKYKPLVDGPQIAHVVGPAGEEIYTDQYGRVKLHFPWDRYSQQNENSSCWVRVSQQWAGRRWGAVAIPRIGHEVIVSFLEGDPDQPVVTGRTYHEGNMPPYRLPLHKTRSTTKSHTHKGDGYNELRFEDATNHEQIYLHGQMDYDQIIENDRREWIRHDRHLRVDHDKFEQVHVNSHQTIGQDKLERVGRNRYFFAGGNFLWKVMGQVHRWIGGSLQLFVGAGRSTVITTSDETLIGVNQSTAVGALSYLKAPKIVLEAGEELTIKGPGGFVKIDAAGVHIKGNIVNINAGGSPGAGVPPKPVQPDAPHTPTLPEDADHRGEY